MKNTHIEFNENPLFWSRVLLCGWTGRHHEANSCSSRFCECAKVDGLTEEFDTGNVGRHDFRPTDPRVYRHAPPTPRTKPTRFDSTRRREGNAGGRCWAVKAFVKLSRRRGSNKSGRTHTDKIGVGVGTDIVFPTSKTQVCRTHRPTKSLSAPARRSVS